MLTILPILGLLFLVVITFCASVIPFLLQNSIAQYDPLSESENKLVLVFLLVAIVMWLVTGNAFYAYFHYNPNP